jgi:hypothetical protein
MAINPFQGPVNYAVDVQSPFEAALSGFKIGAAGAEMQAQAQAREQNQQFQTGLNAFFKNPNRTYEDLEKLLPFADKQQFEALTKVGEGMEKRKLDTEKRFSAQTLLALESDPEVAKTMLQERFEAETDPNQKRALEAYIKTIDINPQKAAEMIELTGAATFGKDWYKGITDARTERRTVAEAPLKLRQELAAADKAEVEARIKMETATDDIAKAKATRMLEEAKAKKEKVQADTELQTRLSEIGFKQAQINKFKVETRNLDTQGKMMSLDFQASLQGLPLPSKKTEGAGAATEDERKAAGWLSQATNAYNNMLGAMYQKGKLTGAERPGFFESAAGTLPFIGEGSAAFLRGTDRQKFVQASSSLSEALLRAATGAGVNKDEAEQKLKELTPLYTDDAATRKQKLAAIPVYLESLKVRAGRAAPSGYQVPMAPVETTQTAIEKPVPAQPAQDIPAANSVTVGGKTYARPANFTDAQWFEYKQSMGVK